MWRVASRNTLNCLIGCLIGDIAMIVYLQAYHLELPMMITMGLAMVAGLVTSVFFESALLQWREGFGWHAAFHMAFSMSFLSMLGITAPVSNCVNAWNKPAICGQARLP